MPSTGLFFGTLLEEGEERVRVFSQVWGLCQFGRLVSCREDKAVLRAFYPMALFGEWMHFPPCILLLYRDHWHPIAMKVSVYCSTDLGLSEQWTIKTQENALHL